jgi:hypothetical protein
MRPLSEKTASLLHIVSVFKLCWSCANVKDPIIFRGLKALTMSNSQQQTLLRLAAEGISVGFDTGLM